MSSQKRGCNVVGESGDGSVDIVFVHGIRGDPYRTWRSKPSQVDGDAATPRRFPLFRSRKSQGKRETVGSGEVYWPRDLLLKDLSNIRVISFGYDAEISTFLHPASDGSIFSIARDLVARLEILRDTTERAHIPIIFVTHSLGGIIVKDALKFSQDQADFQKHLHSIFEKTYGVMFFGTPHRGSDFASIGKLAARVASLGMGDSDHKLLKALEHGSTELQRISDSFSRMLSKTGKGINVYSLVESLPLKRLGVLGKVVDEDSAVIGDAHEGKATLQGNHLEICRFKNSEDPDYQLVSGVLRRWTRLALASQQLQSIEPITASVTTEVIAGPSSEGTSHSKGIEEEPRNVELCLGNGPALRFNLPETPTRHFKGRSGELEAILQAFKEDIYTDKPQHIVGLYGLGGVGKTQLALRYLYTDIARYTAIIWINSSSEAQIFNQFLDLAQAVVDWSVRLRQSAANFSRIAYDLGLSKFVSPTTGEVSRQGDKMEITKAVLSWLSREGNTGWIMVFDNADDLESFDLTSFFPLSENGEVIITSRRSEVKQIGNAIEVRCLEAPSAQEVLVGFAGLDPADSTISEDCKSIVHMLGGLPLALAQAGSYMATSGTPPKEFIDRYHSQRSDILRHKPSKALWRYGETVFTTWEMSYSAILKSQPLAAKLLSSCAYLQPDDIWLGIFSMGASPNGHRSVTWKRFWSVHGHKRTSLARKFKLAKGRSVSDSDFYDIPWLHEIYSKENMVDMVSILSRYSLISYKASSQSISMHPLVRDWCRERYIADREQFSMEALIIIGRALDKVVHDEVSSQTARYFIPHLGTTIKIVHDFEEFILEPSPFTLDIGHALESIGDALTAPTLFAAFGKEVLFVRKMVYELCKKLLQPTNQLLLALMGSLAVALEEEERFTEAATLSYERVKLCISTLGISHADTLSALNDLGKCLQMEHRDLESAEEALRLAVKGHLEMDQNSSSAATPMINLAILLVDQGKFSEARALLEKALDVLELSDNGYLYVQCLGTLGFCLKEEGDPIGALEYLNQTVQVSAAKFGRDAPLTISWSASRSYHEAAGMPLSSTEFVDYVEQNLLQLTTPSTTRNWRVADCAKACQVLGDFYYRIGRIEAAENIYSKSLTMELDDMPANVDYFRSTVFNGIGISKWDSGLCLEAVECYDKAASASPLRGKSESVGMLNRAVALRDQGDHQSVAEAEKIFSEVTALATAENSSVKSDSLHHTNLAQLYVRQGRFDEATILFERTLEAMKNTGASVMISYLLTLHCRALMHEQLRDYDNALSDLEAAYNGKLSSLGPCSTATLKTAIALRRLLVTTGQVERAKELAREISPYYQFA